MPFLTINGKTLQYSDTKPDDFPTTTATATATATTSISSQTIVFIHGLGSTQNYFFPIIPTLTSAGYRCVTFDNYGAGRSKLAPKDRDRPQEQEHSLQTIGQDVLGLMDALEIPSAVLVGYSMGGMVPTGVAALEGKGERVQGAVCIGPVHPTEAVAEVFRKRIPAVRDGGMEAMANTIPYAATGSRATPLHRAFIREMLMAQESEGYIANCRAIEYATPPSYKDVHVPLLIIAGEEDKSAPLKGCEFILGEVSSKDKKLEVLKGVGHWHCVEAGDEVGRLVKEFCDGLKK